jgi:LysR family glycine cleavage system transcriptional activator
MSYSQPTKVGDDQLPSFNAIRSFAVAAKHLSFTEAAKELHVTHGAVSRIVRDLEIELGIPLLRRVGRSLELTPAGAAYYPQIAEAIDRITTATRTIRGLNDGNVLLIGALPTLTMRWLLPRLPRFRQNNPELLIDVITKNGPIDFSTERIDIGILFGSGTWPGSEATFMMPEEVGIFCSPSYIKQNAPLRSPADLPKHTILQNSTRLRGWPHFFTTFGVPPVDLNKAPSFEHFFMIAEAAAASMGVALLPVFLAREEVRAGRLIQPIPHTARPEEAYYIVHSPGVASMRKIRLFKKWIIEEAREMPNPPTG